MGDDADIQIQQLLVAGDPGALARAFSIYGQRLRQAVKLRLDRRLRGRLDESDVMQEAFLSAVQDLPSYSSAPNVSVFVWLHRLTTRRLTDLHREHLEAGRRSILRETMSLNSPNHDALSGSDWAVSDLLASRVTSPSNQALLLERQQHVLKGLQQMDEIDREVLVLRHFELLSNEETATLLNLSTTAASNRYVRALQRLNKIMTKMMELT